jgi:Putative zinc-finger
MDIERLQSKFDCPSGEISSYIDGELSPVRELELERHFLSCETCLAELNLQKKFLIALDHALEGEEEIALPVNFTKVVVANAESRVSGLRRRSERFNALFVCAGLFLVIVFALGASGSNTTLDGIEVVFDKVSAIGLFIFHVAYDIAIGALSILRSLSSHLILDSSVALLFPGIAAVYTLLIAAINRV